MKRTTCVFAIVGIVIGLMTPAQMAFADQEQDDDSLTPIELLTGEWWQWAYSLPLSQNPLTDTTGARCMFGQRGPIWFLAGNEDKKPRTCSVPEGAILFFPVINAVNCNTPGKCGNTSQDLNTLKLLRQSVSKFIDPVPVQDLFATVDGHSIKNLIQRVKSEPFAVALPAKPDNLCGDVDAGIYAPAVDDGYYVLLDPLPVGKHTVTFGSKASVFLQNNTYNLSIEKVSLK